MLPRALLTAVMAAVCISEALTAIPLTERSHTLRDTNSGLDLWGRRRARDTQIQQTTPPPLQTTSPPLGPYFANYSLVGQEVECSDAAKRCLAINKLLYEPWGDCYELGDTFPCRREGGELVLDAESLRRGSLRSKCSGHRSCKIQTPIDMAYDRKCYGLFYVIEEICDGIDNLVFHPLGGHECKIPKNPPERVKQMNQPTSPGRCVIPNLQHNEIVPFWVQCTKEEKECLLRYRLPFRGSCHAPLSNTPCPEGEWLVLDEEAAESGRLIAKCKSSQPCGSDAQLLRADRSCHNNTELIEKLCNNSFISPLPTGEYVCTKSKRRYEVFGFTKENSVCQLEVLERRVGSIYELFTPGIWRGEKCILNDKNICQHYVSPPISEPDIKNR